MMHWEAKHSIIQYPFSLLLLDLHRPLMHMILAIGRFNVKVNVHWPQTSYST